MKLIEYLKWRAEHDEKYTSEKRIKIKSIPTVIVDPHNEVLSSWMEIKNEHALLLHIDRHADMADFVPTLEKAKGNNYQPKVHNYSDFAKSCLKIDDFIAVGIHEKKIGVVYWFNPKIGFVIAYGKKTDNFSVNSLKTRIASTGHIVWEEKPVPEEISLTEASLDISKYEGPIILDIDLDAFYCTEEDDDPRIGFETIRRRLQQTKDFIRSTNRKPIFISIARSQTPITYASSNYVNTIQHRVKKMLNEIF